MQEKLKSWLQNDRLFYGLVILLVGVASFGLGWSANEEGKSTAAEVSLVKSPLESTAREGASGDGVDETEPTLLVASKTGVRYHLQSCPGAKQIKPENKITFPTKAAAEAAGYTPAANCPGL